MIISLKFMILPHHHAELLLNIMEPHHPLLIDNWAIDIYWYLERNFIGHRDINLFLDNFLNWVIYVDGFVDVDGLVEVHRSFYLYIDGFLNYLRGAGDPDLIGHFLLHFYYFLNYSLRPLNIFGHLNPHLYWFFYYNLLDSLFGCSSILIFQLFFQHFNLFL